METPQAKNNAFEDFLQKLESQDGNGFNVPIKQDVNEPKDNLLTMGAAEKKDTKLDMPSIFPLTPQDIGANKTNDKQKVPNIIGALSNNNCDTKVSDKITNIFNPMQQNIGGLQIELPNNGQSQMNLGTQNKSICSLCTGGGCK